MGKPEAVDELTRFIRRTGVAHRVTSMTRPAGSTTAAGNPSCHAADNPRCAAIDIAGPAYGDDTDALGRVFWAFEPVFPYMHELIYAGPQTTFNIKAGKRVAPFATANHHDHVHASILIATRFPEDDMPLNQADQQWLDGRFSTVQGTVTTVQSNLAAELNALKAKVDRIGTGAVDYELLATKVADKLAARLKD